MMRSEEERGAGLAPQWDWVAPAEVAIRAQRKGTSSWSLRLRFKPQLCQGSALWPCARSSISLRFNFLSLRMIVRKTGDNIER